MNKYYFKIGKIINFPSVVIIAAVRIYQIFISPLIGGYYKCRFTPTCSQFMIEAIQKKGLIKGFWLGILRLMRCHPFSKKSGFDPVK